MPAQCLLQDIKDLDMPREQGQLFLTTVNEHGYVIGYLWGEGNSHHASYSRHLAKDRYVRALQARRVDTKQALGLERLEDRASRLKLDQVEDRQLELWHNLPLQM